MQIRNIKMSAIKRLIQFVTHKGISKNAFYVATGLSVGYLNREREIGHKKISSICTTYPEISPDWLLMGRGSMLRDGKPLPPAADDSKSDASDLRATLDTLREQLTVKDEQSKVKYEQINKLIDKIH